MLSFSAGLGIELTWVADNWTGSMRTKPALPGSPEPPVFGGEKGSKPLTHLVTLLNRKDKGQIPNAFPLLTAAVAPAIFSGHRHP
ncbi:hypothetical protein V6N13_107226 [Hibiscus sabdariffa]